MRKDNVKMLFALKDWINDNRDLVGTLDQVLQTVEPFEMEKISFHKSASSVLAIVEKPDMSPQIIGDGPILMLDMIQDPGNLGTIIRTADWFGIKNIYCNHGTADCFNPKVIQSSMGSIFRVNIFYEDLLTVITDHPEIPVWVSSLKGRDIREIKSTGKIFLVIGNESKGVQESIQMKASQKIFIPGFGEAESLNVSVAAGIMMYWMKTNGSI